MAFLEGLRVEGCRGNLIGHDWVMIFTMMEDHHGDHMCLEDEIHPYFIILCCDIWKWKIKHATKRHLKLLMFVWCILNEINPEGWWLYDSTAHAYVYWIKFLGQESREDFHLCPYQRNSNSWLYWNELFILMMNNVLMISFDVDREWSPYVSRVWHSTSLCNTCLHFIWKLFIYWKLNTLV